MTGQQLREAVANHVQLDYIDENQERHAVHTWITDLSDGAYDVPTEQEWLTVPLYIALSVEDEGFQVYITQIDYQL